MNSNMYEMGKILNLTLEDLNILKSNDFFSLNCIILTLRIRATVYNHVYPSGLNLGWEIPISLLLLPKDTANHAVE